MRISVPPQTKTRTEQDEPGKQHPNSRQVSFIRVLRSFFSWVLFKWWRIFVVLVLGNYVPGAIFAWIQSGDSALRTYLTSWGLLRPFEQHNPYLFWLLVVILALLVPVGALAEYHMLAEQRRQKEHIETERQGRIDDAQLTAQKAQAATATLQTKLGNIEAVVPAALDVDAARAVYLDGLVSRFSTLIIPVGMREVILDLQAAFVPLQLHTAAGGAFDTDPSLDRSADDEESAKFAFATHPAHAVDQSVRSSDKEQQLPEPESITAINEVDALAKSPQKRIVILGGPGTGKTTVLKHLVCQAALKAKQDKLAPLPIFISVTEFAKSGKSLQQYLTLVVTDLGADERFADIIWRALTEGGACVCLDGIDELAPAQRPALLTMIERDAPRFGGVWIIGSRYSEYREGQFGRNSFVEWELDPLDQPKQLELARVLLPRIQESVPTSVAARSVSAETFISTLSRQARMMGWAENPLLFSLAAIVYVQSGTVPTVRMSLYQRVIDAVLEMREKDPIWRAATRRVLADFALWLFLKKEQTFTRDILLEFLADIQKRPLAEAADAANRILQSGIIKVGSYETFSFGHLSFQEYLAASALASDMASEDRDACDTAYDLAWSKRTFSRWTEILRLLVGILAQDHGSRGARALQRWFIELLAQHATPDGDIGDLGMALAISSLKEMEESSLSKEVSELALPAAVARAWVDALFDAAHRGQRLREQKLKTLCHPDSVMTPTFSREVVTRMVPALSSSELAVAEVATITLMQAEDHIPLDDLVSVLASARVDTKVRVLRVLRRLNQRMPIAAVRMALADQDGRVRCAAVQTISGLGEDVVLKHSTPMLEDPFAPTRIAAIRVLAEIGRRAPVDKIVLRLEDTSQGVRVAALEALGQLGDRAPIEPIVAALDDGIVEIRVAAVRALGQLGDRAPIEPIVAALDDGIVEIRVAAVRALGQLGDRAPVEPIVAALQDPDPSVQRVAVQTLGQFGEHTPIEVIIAALRHRDKYVRQLAVEIVRNLGDQFPYRQLLLMVEETDWRSRASAISTLGSLGQQAPIEMIAQALSDEDPRVRKVAVRAIGKLGRNAPLALIVGALDDRDEWVRVAAVETLVTLHAFMQVPVSQMAQTLVDSYPQTKEAAAQFLAQVGHLAPAGPLLTAVHSGALSVRIAAVEALGHLAANGMVPVDVIVPLLHEEFPQGRVAALQALGKVGDRAPVEPIVAALRDPELNVRLAALQALGQLGERAPVEPLMALLHDDNHSVRQFAVETVGRQKNVPVVALLDMMRDPHWEVRKAAARALGSMQAHAPVQELVSFLFHHNRALQKAAAAALRAMGTSAPLEPLLRALEVNPFSNRKGIVAALGALGERAPVDLLVSLLHDKEWEVRRAAVRALGELGERAPIEPIIEATRDEHWIVSASAVDVLGELGPRVPIEPIITAADSENANVRATAIRSLTSLGKRVPIDVIVRCTGDSHPSVRGAAAPALAKQAMLAVQDDHIPVDLLVSLLHDKEWEVRRAAVRALGELGERAPIEPIIEATRDEHSGVREAGAIALGKRGLRAPITPLITAIGDWVKDVRIAAAKAVIATHSEGLEDLISEANAALDGQAHGMVFTSQAKRYWASLLGQMKPASKEVISALSALLHWPNWHVRQEAAIGLGKLRKNIPASTIRRLIELRKDPGSVAVREAADTALTRILSLETGIEDD